MNTPLMRASNREEEALPSSSTSRKRPKHSPRRAFSVATRAFLTLALATCAFGAAASAQNISISPPAPGNEGNTGKTNFDFVVSIDQAPTQAQGDITVNFTVNGISQGGSVSATGSATGASPADFANAPAGGVLVDGAAPASNTVTFPVGSTASHVITVPVTGDTAFEANETFAVTLNGATGGANADATPAATTILNDDNPPSISVADAQPVVEGNTGTRTATFRVSLSQTSGQDVTFTYNTVVTDPRNAGDGFNGGTTFDAQNQDFERQDNQVAVIQANSAQPFVDITVPIISDLIDESDGQFLLVISNVTGADIAKDQAIGTIIDDDGPTVRVSDDAKSEGDGQVVFRIQLSAPSPQRITIQYRTISNSARAGLDYTSNPLDSNQSIDPNTGEVVGTVVFEPFDGDPSAGVAPFVDVPIQIIQDEVIEGTEIFSLFLVSADNNASLTGTNTRRQATGTITDDDGPADLTVSAVSTTGTVEGAQGTTTNAQFRVALNNPSSTAVSFRYETVPGTATAGTDYSSRTGTATIPAYNQANPNSTPTFALITVPVLGDNIDEANETFGLRVFSVSPSTVTVGGGTTQTVNTTIIDDDGPVFRVLPTNVDVNEGSNNARTSAAFTVQLTAASPQPVTVTYTLGSANNANEATRGQDYLSSAVTGTLTFPAGTTTQLVPVSIVGDNTDESNEIITLTLSNPNGGSVGAGATGTITIIDDDALPVVSITAETPSFLEGSGGGFTNVRFRVALDRASGSTITVNYTVNDGTAVAGVLPDGDFTDPTAANPITFNPGTIGPQFITVPIYRDNLNENDENFSVSLSGPTNSRIGIGTATATIRNDDAVPTISIFDVSNVEKGDPPPQGQQQGPRIFSFQVRLSAASGKTVTASYGSIGAGTGNVALTALSGTDFVPVGGALTFAPGQTTATIDVVINDDALDENNEQFQVRLNTSTNANIARGTATGTIIDDDNAPNIDIDAPDADNTAIEPYITQVGGTPNNGRNAVFPVTLSAASGRTVTVTYFITGVAPDPAFSNDFLASATDTTRVFQQGTLVFTPNGNGVTPTRQNIVLFPRGDDGDEPTENYRVTIAAVNANFAAAADAFANSNIQDRDPNFDNFAPDAGYETFGNTLGTIVTITGNQFVTDNQNRVQAVRFTGPTGAALNANIINVTANTITCRLPAQAYSSFVQVVLTSGRVLNSTDPGSRRLFYAQPIVTGFNPTSGVPAVTAVTITGRHFKDPRNPVTAVLFNGLATTAQNADRGFTIISDTQILAYVPRGGTSGPISIRTAFGGNGPGSEDTFTVNGFATGGIRLIGADLSPVYENASATLRVDNGQILDPVKSFLLQLRPATQNNGNNTPIAPRRQVDVTVTLTAATPANATQIILPVIQLDTRQRLDGISLVRASSSSFTFRIAAGRDPNLTIPVIVTYAGDDNAPPATQGNLAGSLDPATGIVIPTAGSGVQMTLRTEITASSDTELYPNNEFQEVQFERRDIHTFATDTGVAYRTTEDQNSVNNKAVVPFGLANLDFPNPAPPGSNARAVRNPINIDARPKNDVTVTFTTSRPDEGLLTYYVVVKGQKIYPSGATPQNNKPVIFSTNPAANEYYRNPHFLEVTGQDDQVADTDQQYTITATSVTSQDREYNNFPTQLPFTFVNTDNEQSGNGNSAGYAFSKSNLNTDENGQQDVFTTFLRTRPSGNVSINFQSTRVDEVLFVDPNNPDGPGLTNLTITYLASGTGNGRNTTFYQTPLAIRVKGVDDDLRDGDQQALIVTSVVGSADSTYGAIDPPDLIDLNRDNESNGITVLPTTLSIDENGTDTFSIRLNARPTSNVTITLSSSDTSVVNVVGATTLIFTPSNYNIAQTVTVQGFPDGGFAQTRTATIVTSAAQSGDPNFNQLDVADVTVIVRNSDSAFVVNAATGGLRTSEGGTNDLFTVSLGQAPTANVSLILSINPASEARLSRTASGGTASVTLTFTPTNFATPQTVNVIGQDDTLADGDKAFTITGRVTTTDTVYATQPFPALRGINADNESGTGGGGNGGNATSPNFAANSTYTFSTPYANSTAATATIPVSQLFTTNPSDFKIYRFNVGGQQNSRLIGQDFQLVPSNGVIQRGIGYILQTGATPLTLRTAQPYNGTGFAFVLSRNPNFVSQTGQSNSNNGLNFIGFPFNPAQFGSVSFASAMVQSGTDTYQSVSAAAAAGVMSDKLYTMNPQGQLVEVPASNQVLRPYGAYFVRIYRDNVTLTFRSPSAN